MDKVCKRCGELKPLNAYRSVSIRSTGKPVGGHEHVCLDCRDPVRLTFDGEPVTTRVYHVLLNALDCKTWDDVSRIDPADILKAPNLGAKSFREIMNVLDRKRGLPPVPPPSPFVDVLDT